MKKSNELYDILGLNPNCTKEEIRKAYKSAAIKYHPDKLKSDATSNEKNMFVKVQHAYEILSNDEKRQQYDIYGDSNGTETENYDVKISEIFDMIFKFRNTNTASQAPEPICINVDLTLYEVINGVKKTIILERRTLVDIETNKTVSPSGIIFTCENCKGSGSILVTNTFSQNKFVITQSIHPCNKCKSLGYINLYPNKFAIIKKKCKFDYKFQSGTRNGDRFTLVGLGDINLIDHKNNGNIVIIVQYDTGKFKTDLFGNLIHIQTISIFEAITGSEFLFIHPDSQRSRVKIPPITPNFQKVVKKFGLPQNIGGEIIITDLIIVFEIIYPDITDDQKKIIKKNFADFYHNIEHTNGLINLDFTNFDKL